MLLLAVFSHVWNFSFLPQIEGAFIQGMGLYTIEELNYSPQGVLYTRGPNQYKIPAICAYLVSILHSGKFLSV